MLIWLLWSVGGIAVINVVALVALCVAYTWHHGLELVREERRHARQQPFERLLPPAMGGSHHATRPVAPSCLVHVDQELVRRVAISFHLGTDRRVAAPWSSCAIPNADRDSNHDLGI